MEKQDPLPSFPPPCCKYWWISGPPEQFKWSPLLPHKEKVFFLLFPRPVYVPHPFTNDPLDPYPTPCTLAMNVDWGPLFNSHSHLSWPAVLTASSILINFIFLSFCLMSGNSFPTRAQTTRKVTILLDLLKSVKQLEFNLSMNSYLTILFHCGAKSSFIEQNFQHY